jgi:hypothetical protein
MFQASADALREIGGIKTAPPAQSYSRAVTR